MKPFPILLVEDDENDIFFFRRAVTKNNIPHPLHVVRDGLEATEYLSGTGRFAKPEDCQNPGLIVLDLNLPHKNGLEVLQWLRAQPATRRTIVVVLTSSAALQDIEEAYDSGANSYLVKPGNSDRLIGLVESLKLYWLGVNTPAFKEAPGRL